LQSAYQACADKEKLSEILGRGRAKKGMFEGDLVEGELEIGQIAGLIKKIMPAGEIVQEMMTEFQQALTEQKNYL
jgi:enoyl-[acyl-carrier protein] reductase II